jgi:hypothetical protein
VVEYIEILLSAEGRIYGCVDHAGQGAAHVDEVPFRAVSHYADNPGAGLETEGEEASGGSMRESYVIFGAILNPLIVNTFCQQIWFVGADLLEVVEEVKYTSKFHNTVIGSVPQR